MLIAICVTCVAISQVAGLWLIAKALGQDAKSSEHAREDANIQPTLSSDYGGLA